MLRLNDNRFVWHTSKFTRLQFARYSKLFTGVFLLMVILYGLKGGGHNVFNAAQNAIKLAPDLQIDLKRPCRQPLFKTIQSAVLLKGGEEEILPLLCWQLSWFRLFLAFVIQLLEKFGWALSFWDGIGSGHSTDYPTPAQVNRPGGEVPQHDDTFRLPSLSSVYVLMMYSPFGRSALSSE